MPEQRTPQARILQTFFGGRAALLDLPVNVNYAILEAPTLPTELGFLQNFPRLYSVVDVKKSGAHAHKPGTESEIMVVVAGCAAIYLWDETGHREKIELGRAITLGHGRHLALFIQSGVWHTVRYHDRTVLNVAASCIYDRSYYIEKPEDYFTPKGLEEYQRSFAEID